MAHGEKKSKWLLKLPNFLAWHYSGYLSSVFQVRLLCKCFLNWATRRAVSSYPEKVMGLFLCYSILSLGLKWDGFAGFLPRIAPQPSGTISSHRKGGSAVTILWFTQDRMWYRLSTATTLCSLLIEFSDSSLANLWKPPIPAVGV